MDTNEKAQKEIQEVLKKYGLQLSYKLEFPIYRIIPEEAKLAMKILERYAMHIVLTFKPNK